MRLYPIRTPRIIQRIFSNYTWCFQSIKKELFLTFDDGPTPEVTEFVLDTLDKYNAKATFFCIGKNVVNHPEIFQRIHNAGHSIGNHTHNHYNGWKHSTKEYISNIKLTENHIQKEYDFKTTLFRPPYGRITSKQTKELLKNGYKIIMWSVLSADFDKNISKEKCLENVLKNTKNGDLIVFHDSLKASEKLNYVLPKILTYYSEKGFEFKSIV
ncbi:polysaccharide deacetylase [Tenacibaculum holothuriorum]|uniref:Polysaccharide deacetylase n=1 Tax=Tenacibaculum holothuriorum TaxID=1635173 RepID=A0A1Y2PGB8_9FLAO|nr:polysaccharide deacetylase family protein [Tenacibaculum holothuriorum]OSY88759.1 polysaccharide deacetylase [Tenacibaculum holothuriorum]